MERQTCVFMTEVNSRHPTFFLTLTHQRHRTMPGLGWRGLSLNISFLGVFFSKEPLNFWHIDTFILKIFSGVEKPDVTTPNFI